MPAQSRWIEWFEPWIESSNDSGESWARWKGQVFSYAVTGDQAVAVWVRTVDEAAARNSPEIEVLLRQSDLDRARAALEGEGFVYRHTAGLDVFLDGPEASVRDAVHIVFTGEKVREHEPAANPDLSESSRGDGFQVLTLEALVQIKLTAHRDKDRTHLRDLIEVGLVDESWVAKLPTELGERLQSLLDDHWAKFISLGSETAYSGSH